MLIRELTNICFTKYALAAKIKLPYLFDDQSIRAFIWE